MAVSTHHFLLHHPALLTAARVVTWFGAAAVVDTVTVLTAVALLLRGRRREAALVAAVRVITLVLTIAIKAAVGRPRPSFARPFGHWAGASFPSGHASGAASTYLPLAVVVIASLHRRWARRLVVGMAVIGCLLVAASRVLLGAHYLSDVLAGLALGGAVLALCWATAQRGPGLLAGTHGRLMRGSQKR